ncbi:MAG: glycine zipper domain-containing protein [Burkholderiaceae bacterium]
MDTLGSIKANSNDISNTPGMLGGAEKSDAHAKIDSATGVARTAVDNLSAGAHVGFDKAVNAVNKATETLETKQVELKIAQAKMLENSRIYVQQNPLTSVGIAAAVGYVLSRLVKSRS